MKDFFEELGKYIGETATIVGNKAGEVIETQKLKSQVRSLTHENTVDLLELGRGVYEQYKSGAVLDEKAEGLCEAISSREESIAEFEEKISAIKGAGKCPNCGKMVAKEMVFCPYCGEKMPAVTVDEEETPGDDTEDVTLREEEASLFEEEAVKGDAAKQATESTAVLPVLNTIQLKSDLVNLIGEERIERSILNGGTSAISCWKSYWIPGTEEINVVIEYKIKIPVPLMKSPSVKLKDEFKVSAWNGYQKDRKGNEDGQIIYITEKGTVWHSDYQCSYLQLSIQYVQYSELQNMRNEGGGKYHKCEQCVYGQAMNGVYITSYGNRYHNSLNCSSLKRTIRAVHKSEVAGRGGCSKCAK